MDKRLILAVAGSGKTKFIIDKLCLEKRHLIITYTINNEINIRERIITKFGFFPVNINLTTYFPFLYKFCYRPSIAYSYRDKGMEMKTPPEYTRRIKRTDLKYYMTPGKRLYHNRLALLVVKYRAEFITKRLVKYYDNLFVDEFQDFAGHDFNLIKHIVKSPINVCLVGDFHQHTFDTSRDGRTNINLHKSRDKYLENCNQLNLLIDVTTLNNSWRCSSEVCSFVSDKLGIEIGSNRSDSTKIKIIDSIEEAIPIIENDSIIKLFNSASYKYDCSGDNWGAVKGINNYNDVCVVMTKGAFENLLNDTLQELAPTTKSKLYVAITRTRGDLYFMHPDLLKEYKMF